jgi:hydrophobic/amphiphilic exporter-1 (mainly G- bacteria), HAE1 family
MLVGLAAKNAILIVEFAIAQRADGKSPSDAVIAAAQTRLRPILMTSIAFIASRQSLGTAVVGGMIVSTVLNLIFVPAMYLIVDEIGARVARLGARFSGRPATPLPVRSE